MNKAYLEGYQTEKEQQQQQLHLNYGLAEEELKRILF